MARLIAAYPRVAPFFAVILYLLMRRVHRLRGDPKLRTQYPKIADRRLHRCRRRLRGTRR